MIDIKLYISNNLNSFEIKRFINFYRSAIEYDNNKEKEYSLEIIFDYSSKSKIISNINDLTIDFFNKILNENNISKFSAQLFSEQLYEKLIETLKEKKHSTILESINKFNKNNSENTKNVFLVEFYDNNNSELTKEVDPQYLSYLALFLTDFPKSKVKFTFIQKNNFETSRIFSLKLQLEHIKHTFPIKKEQIILVGKYLKKETGELKPIYWEHPKQSKGYIPPIFINNKNITYFFETPYTIQKDSLLDNYFKKIIIEICDRTSSNKDSAFISKLRINKLTYIEITLLRLLLNKDIYESLSNINAGKLRDVEKNDRIERNKDKIEYYIKFVKEIAKGLKELALNINHSTYKKGVITARVFETKKLLSVKNNTNDIQNFLNKRNETFYLNRDNKRFFLDINVIDFGKTSIRDKYIKNIEENRAHFEKIIASKFSDNENKTKKKKLINFLGIDFEKDIKHLKDKKIITYKDFYILNREKYSLLSHQQNKYITRIGLQYFTQLYKNKFKAYIKASSQNEGDIIYTGKDEDINSEFTNSGTTYNCIVPIKIKEFDILKKELIEERRTPNPINTFEDLSKYNFIDYDENRKNISNINDYSILKYTKSIQLNHERYNNVISVLINIYRNYEQYSNNILIIDALDLNLNKDAQQDASEWVRLLISLNSIFKDIIVTNLTIEKTKNILEYRKAWSSAGFNFWLDNSRVLFYSYKEIKEQIETKPKTYRRYGATILAGKSVSQFNYLNTNIWRHHYSFSPKDEIFEKETTINNKLIKYGTHFFNNEHLKYFELIIKNKDSNNSLITLFETSIQYSLNKTYKSTERNTHNRGYKISNTHFRLGSKIHISDFYYAKRLFQNSFFTTPLSFLISKSIFKTIINDIKKYPLISYCEYPLSRQYKNSFVCHKYSFTCQSFPLIIYSKLSLPNHYKHLFVCHKYSFICHKYSLIGYDKYSDFLLSSTRNLLEKRIGEYKPKNGIYDIKINHFTLSKNGKLSREPENLYSNTFIIVPIASTFSTSIKMEKDLNGIINRYNFYLLNIIFNNIKKINSKKNYKNLLNLNNLKDCLLDINKRNILIKKIEANREKKNYKLNNIINEIKEKVLLFKDKFIPQQKTKDYLNIILVGHREKKYGKCFDEVDDIKIFDNGLLKAYNWEHVNGLNKIVNVKEYNNNSNKTYPQKYFIPLYSEWNKAENCSYCFPEKINNERCLIETGSASVTPQLIFSLPRTKEKKHNSKKNILNFKGSLLYGNLYRKNKKYLFYTRTGALINNKTINKINIIKWIKTSLKPLFKDYTNQKVVIVSPASSAKSNFIDLINEYLFEYTANCVFISLGEDYIENAESLYWDALYNADIVVFVDDILYTTKSFLGVNHIIKYIRDKFNNGNGIDYCIALLNRTSLDDEQNLILKLLPLNKEDKLETVNSRLIYFSKINNPPIEDPDNKFPLKKEQQRYKILSNISSIDGVRQEFNNNRIRLKKINLSNLNNYNKVESENVEDDGKKYRNRKLFQFLILDAFYSLFSDNKDFRFKSLNELEDVILKIIKDDATSLSEQQVIYSSKRIATECNEHLEIINKYKNNLKYVILKIMCNSPIVYYKDLREKALEWIIFELIEFEKGINKEINFEFLKSLLIKNKDEYSKLQNLKFLLKRSIHLKSNYLIRKETFAFLEKIINSLYINKERLQNLYIEEYKKYYKTSSKKINYYLVSLIQELVLGHETKSIKLEENINNCIYNYNKKASDKKNKNYNIANGDFLHYLRLLKLENTEIAHKFCKQINKEETRTSKTIKPVILNTKYKDHPKYKLLKKHLLFEQKIDDYQEFVNIKIELNNYRIKKLDNISDFFQAKILKSLNIILGKQVVSSHFIINYNNEKKDIKVTDLYEFKVETKKIELLVNFDNSITKKMFTNIDAEVNGVHQLSNFEIFTIENKKLYREEILSGFIQDSFEYTQIKNEIKSILLIRISDFNKDNNKLYTQAVLTFFLKNERRIPEEKLRLILLLRKSLSKFLKAEISKNTFGELLKFDEKEKFILKLKHSIGKFTNFQKGIYYATFKKDIKTKWKEYREKRVCTLEDYQYHRAKFEIDFFTTDEKIFQIITNSIKRQTGASLEGYKDSSSFIFSELLKDYAETIFKSSYIHDSTETITVNPINFSPFKIPSIIIDVVIPELIINMKKYGKNNDISINEIDDSLIIIFTNQIKNRNNKGYGLTMLRKIIASYNNDIELFKNKTGNNIFSITLKINKSW